MMTIQKFGDAEQAEVFVGPEAAVVNDHLRKVAKPVSEFSDEEKASLQRDLEALRPDSSNQKKETVSEPEVKPPTKAKAKSKAEDKSVEAQDDGAVDNE